MIEKVKETFEGNIELAEEAVKYRNWMKKHLSDHGGNVDALLIRITTESNVKWERQFRDMLFGVRIYTETTHKICVYGSFVNLPEFAMNDDIGFKLRFYADIIHMNKHGLWTPKPEKFPFVRIASLNYEAYKELSDEKRKFHFGPALILSELSEIRTLAGLTDKFVGYQGFGTTGFTVPVEHPKAREIEYRHMETFVITDEVMKVIT